VLTLITEKWEKELALMSKDEAAKCLLDELLKLKIVNSK
jgi:phosphopantothenoylcysteine decarboxylase/phosphopantothenate--cysteine ligase